MDVFIDAVMTRQGGSVPETLFCISFVGWPLGQQLCCVYVHLCGTTN
jgi:hypothetical protein